MPAIFELKNEWVIASYPSSLWTTALPRPGTLFISANYLGFASSAAPIKIRFLDIVHIKRFNNGGFAAQLAIQLFIRQQHQQQPSTSAIAASNTNSNANGGASGSPKDFTFATLFQGEELYLLVVELWKATAAKVQKNASLQKREREQQRKASPAPPSIHIGSSPLPSPSSPSVPAASITTGTTNTTSTTSLSSSPPSHPHPFGRAASSGTVVGGDPSILDIEETEQIQKLLRAARGAEEDDEEDDDDDDDDDHGHNDDDDNDHVDDYVNNDGQSSSSSPNAATASAAIKFRSKRENIFVKQEHDYLCALYHVPDSQRLLTTRSDVSLTISLRKDGKINAKPTATNVEGLLSVFTEFLLFRSNKAAQPSSQQQQQPTTTGGAPAAPLNTASTGATATAPPPSSATTATNKTNIANTNTNTNTNANASATTTVPPGGAGQAAAASSLDVFIIIPLREVQQIKKSHHVLNDEYSDLGNIGVLPDTIKIYTNYNLLSFSLTNRNSLLKLLMQLHRVSQRREVALRLPKLVFAPATAPTSTSSGSILLPSTFSGALRSHRVVDEMLNDPREFPPGYAESEKDTTKQFESYLLVHGFGVAMLRGSKLRSLIRTNSSGIPNTLRGMMWSVLSGAQATRISSPRDLFESLVAKALVDPSNVGNKNQIELDLHRSLPEHPYFQHDEGLGELRRCLLAYSIHNPTVGYCQSMNIIASLLLLFAESSEEAFYMLDALIALVPEYYIREMLGSIVDLRIFSGYVNKHRPKLWHHLHGQCGMDLTLVALPWFLCFYVGYLPWAACLRTFDMFFLEGPSVLFQMGLALLASHEDALLQLKDQVAVTEYLKSATHDCDKILKVCLCNANHFSLLLIVPPLFSSR
jgi:hypothetical protein